LFVPDADLMEAKRQRSPTLVIGVGNEWRGDDAAGLLVARQLRRCGTSLSVLEHDGEGAALMELWNRWDAVIIVDAVHSGAEPGTVYRFDAISQPLPSKIRHGSTHSFSLGEAIELGRALNQLPRHLVVYAIEGQNFEAGNRLSSQVEGVISAVADRILREIHAEGSLLPSDRAGLESS
jgi:hydrogenase maturation protease